MRKIFSLIRLVVLITTVSFFQSYISIAKTGNEDKIDEFINVVKLSDRVLVIRTGVFYFDAVMAIATQKGIVVFDAGFSPTLTKKYREIIEKEFGRDDFAYLINTHGHWDHTNGNKVFPKAVIIGHNACESELMNDTSDKDGFLSTLKGTLGRLKETLSSSDSNSDYGRQVNYRAELYSLAIQDFESDYTFKFPTMTFNDKLTLNMGDLTFEFFYFGKAHSQSDIVVYIPEERLLMAGDLFNRGGSVNFSQLNAGNVTKPDVEQWHRIMRVLLSDDCDIEWIIDGHAAMLTRDDLVAFNSNVDFLWNEFNSGRDLSARIKLEQVYHESGLEEMIRAYNNMKTIYRDKYYYFESSLIDFGYHLLRDNQTKAAVEVFKVTVEQFPDSWNAYDCLGEAYMKDGNNKLAIENYEKSLEMNSDNNNAKEMLKEMKGN